MSSIHDEWLGLVRPTGVVVEPRVLDELALVPARLSAEDGMGLESALSDGKLADAKTLFVDVLGWNADLVNGLDGDPVPADLSVRLPEHETILSPTHAIPEFGEAADGRWQLLVRVEARGIGPDGVNQLDGWSASPHHRMERLLRDAGVPAGLLVTDDRVRLITAPKGETSGWIDFLFGPMTEVAGRPILAGMKLLLGPARFFYGDGVSRLPALLRSSRQAQDNVSTELSKQVLAALHELLRGLYAADPELVADLARERPEHLYEGLLAVLMRLVFILYAEDRDLMPSRRDGDWLSLYENSYSLRRLRERLEEDAALFPDTMDERRGAWGQLLALFRLVSDGDQWGWMQSRRGKLFDPDSYPFLEGRPDGAAEPLILPLSDGCVRNILNQLVVLNGKRLSYRSLDVEQIGSVYETIMGFTVRLAAGPSLAIKAGDDNRTPVFVDLVALTGIPAKDRLKELKSETGRGKFGTAESKIKAAGDAAALAAAFAEARAIDERASPGGRVVVEGTPILQPTAERRDSGSHYTPRSLTEPIVRRALEPAFERLGAEALPEQVLELKICDPAMGSGAFLVESCRQIADRLLSAWARHEGLRPAIPADEDEIIHARRLVAQRCIYGVDRNPMAADLAKLSIWLATLARDHEFSFVDHALKCGESLVGLTRKQIEGVTFEPTQARQPELWKHLVAQMLERSLAHRETVRAAADDIPMEQLAAELSEAETDASRARLIGDAAIACFFGSNKQRARRLAVTELADLVAASRWDAVEQRALPLDAGAHPIRPFHWQIEYPEVFDRENPGFDAIVGNPPFAGKNTLKSGTREHYLDWLKHLHPDAHGNADLAAHFYRRAFALLRAGGCFGLIATNTISQGDTRESGLRYILANGGQIFHAMRRLKWPGEAAVVVSVVHVIKEGQRAAILDGCPVRRISAYLVEGEFDDSPALLRENARRSFQGSILLGMGFTFDDKNAAEGKAWPLDEMRRVIAGDEGNRGIIKPYLGGEEVNNSPTFSHHRFAIDFFNRPLRRAIDGPSWTELTDIERRAQLTSGLVARDYPNEVAADWPKLLSMVEESVKPERASQTRKALKERWWQYAEKRPGLYSTIEQLDRVCVLSRVSPMLMIAQVPTGPVFADSTVIFAFDSMGAFAVLQSRLHEIWARFFSSSMKDDLRYAPSDCFESFPFPELFESDQQLAGIGQTYLDYRSAYMVGRQSGLTATYNLFHDENCADSDIHRLRELHAALDRTVLAAYGWGDLVESAEAQFLTQENETEHAYQGRYFWPSVVRDQILSRLLELNKSRAAEGGVLESSESEDGAEDLESVIGESAE